MIDSMSFDKIIAYGEFVLKLLDGEKASPEDFRESFAKGPPGKRVRVLREMTEDEAYLFFMSFSIFRAISKNLQALMDRGYTRFAAAPGGLWLKLIGEQSGLMAVTLVAGAYEEYTHEVSELAAGTHRIGFDLIDDTLCFVLFEPEKGMSDEDMLHTLIGQVVQSVLENKKNGSQSSMVDADFDIANWNPGSEKIQ